MPSSWDEAKTILQKVMNYSPKDKEQHSVRQFEATPLWEFENLVILHLNHMTNVCDVFTTGLLDLYNYPQGVQSLRIQQILAYSRNSPHLTKTDSVIHHFHILQLASIPN